MEMSLIVITPFQSSDSLIFFQHSETRQPDTHSETKRVIQEARESRELAREFGGSSVIWYLHYLSSALGYAFWSLSRNSVGANWCEVKLVWGTEKCRWGARIPGLADLYWWTGAAVGRRTCQGQGKANGQSLLHIVPDIFLALWGPKGGTPKSLREVWGRGIALSFL